jgi:ubiquinone/menaquinone biosynthesis C-methylase UbiE
MGVWEKHLLPRVIDKMCGAKDMLPHRQRALAGLRGTVLEIGFGSGLNLAAYPPEVTKVLAVEPSELARRLAQPRIEQSAIDVEFVGLDGATIPLDDDVADGAVSAFTLCTIPGVERALAEVRRVLKPGAPFHIVEHGLAPDAGVQKWQHRIEPVNKKIAGGCHLSRDPIALLRAAGFAVEGEDHEWMKAPKPWGYLTFATARAA